MTEWLSENWGFLLFLAWAAFVVWLAVKTDFMSYDGDDDWDFFD